MIWYHVGDVCKQCNHPMLLPMVDMGGQMTPGHLYMWISNRSHTRESFDSENEYMKKWVFSDDSGWKKHNKQLYRIHIGQYNIKCIIVKVHIYITSIWFLSFFQSIPSESNLKRLTGQLACFLGTIKFSIPTPGVLASCYITKLNLPGKSSLCAQYMLH